MGKDSKTQVRRCPYCVAGGSFRVMELQSDGEWLLCTGCGHLALRSPPFFNVPAASAPRLTEGFKRGIHGIRFSVHCEESKALPKTATGVPGT